MQFKIIGNEHHFVIKSKAFNFIFISFFFLYLLTPIMLLNKDIHNVNYWIVLVVMIIVFMIMTWLLTPHDLFVNVSNRTIIKKSSNLILRFIKPALEINFNEIEKFSYKTITLNSTGFKGKKHIVYLHFKSKKERFLELPSNVHFMVDPDLFLQNITALTK